MPILHDDKSLVSYFAAKPTASYSAAILHCCQQRGSVRHKAVATSSDLNYRTLLPNTVIYTCEPAMHLASRAEFQTDLSSSSLPN
jgi:hypothetical protein